jgi:hypothetical protein
MHADEHVGLEALIVESEANSGTQRTFELGGVGVVGDDGDRPTVADEGSRGGCRFTRRIRNGTTVGIGVVPGGREPVVDPQTGVTEGTRQRGVEGADRWGLIQLGDDPGDGPPLSPHVQQHLGHPKGNENDGGAADDKHRGIAGVTRILQQALSPEKAVGDGGATEKSAARKNQPVP